MECLSAYFLGKVGGGYATFLPELVILESCPAIQAFKPRSIFRSLEIHYFSLKNTILTPFHLSNPVNNLERKRITAGDYREDEGAAVKP